MAVGLEYISLIVPIEKIEEHYPGGFLQYKIDKLDAIGRRIWYDDYLVRDGAMSENGIGLLIEEWEGCGLKGVIEVDGQKHWKYLCVVDYVGGATLPCDWLKSEGESVSHINDNSKKVIGRDDMKNIDGSLHDSVDWLKKFEIASVNKSGFRELRKEIYEQTLDIVKEGEYNLYGEKIQLDNSKITKETVFYTKPKQLTLSSTAVKTEFSVLDADCIETAESLKKEGYNVCLLNMANRQKSGGGVLNGAGAQEENIFRRSNLFLSLYQFHSLSDLYGITRNKQNSYPLDRDTGGVYTKDATIFRGSEEKGYCLLKNPFKLSVVSVAAMNKPDLEVIDSDFRITQRLIEPSKRKIRTILRIAGEHHHDCLVLSAFGCGAFRNPPKHMAELFKEVFNELEFVNQFKKVAFAIFDDHNSGKDHNPDGNMVPFRRVFDNGSMNFKITDREFIETEKGPGRIISVGESHFLVVIEPDSQGGMLETHFVETSIIDPYTETDNDVFINTYELLERMYPASVLQTRPPIKAMNIEKWTNAVNNSPKTSSGKVKISDAMELYSHRSKAPLNGTVK